MNLRRNKGRSPESGKIIGRNVPVVSYYRPARAQSKSISVENQNKTEKRRGLSLSQFINYVLVLGAVGLIIFATTLTQTPVIELRKDNAKYYEAEVYELAAQEAMKSTIFNRSKLFFQEKDFVQNLKERFPEISIVKPVIPLGGRNLSVIIAVSKPFAYVTSGVESGILNSDGVLIVKDPQSVPDSLIRLRFTEPQSNFSTGLRILTASELDLITLLVREMEGLQFTDKTNGAVKEILFNVADGQVEVQLQNKPFYIKFSTFTTDGNQQVGGAVATLKQLDRESSLPTKYIDVRVPGRVFVL